MLFVLLVFLATTLVIAVSVIVFTLRGDQAWLYPQRLKAYHEAGHALLVYHHGLEIKYVTIEPNYELSAGGFCDFNTAIHVTDRKIDPIAFDRAIIELRTLIGGLVGSNLGLGRSDTFQTSTATESDWLFFKEIIRAMNLEWGIDEKITDETALAQRIEHWVRRLGSEAEEIIKSRRVELDKIANALIRRRTLNNEEFAELMASP